MVLSPSCICAGVNCIALVPPPPGAPGAAPPPNMPPAGAGAPKIPPVGAGAAGTERI